VPIFRCDRKGGGGQGRQGVTQLLHEPIRYSSHNFASRCGAASIKDGDQPNSTSCEIYVETEAQARGEKKVKAAKGDPATRTWDGGKIK